jgi:hypothetical protein
MMRMLGVALGVVAAFLLGVRVGMMLEKIRARRAAKRAAAASGERR